MIEIINDHRGVIYHGKVVGVGTNLYVCIVVLKIYDIDDTRTNVFTDFTKEDCVDYGVFVYDDDETLYRLSQDWFMAKKVSICSEPRVRRITGIDYDHLRNVFGQFTDFNFIL